MLSQTLYKVMVIYYKQRVILPWKNKMVKLPYENAKTYINKHNEIYVAQQNENAKTYINKHNEIYVAQQMPTRIEGFACNY